MSHWSASRMRVGGAVILAVGTALAAWFALGRSGSPARDHEQESRPVSPAPMKSADATDHDKHVDLTPRPKTDSTPGRIRGCVSRGGKPVAGVRLEATVLPTGEHWTVDHAVSGADGCYEIVVTSNNLEGRQVASIVVEEGLVGRLEVEVAPGRTTEHADIEVGKGFVIRGVVRYQSGAAAPYVRVSDGRFALPYATDEKGRFALRVETPGRHRLRVFPLVIDRDREYEQVTPVMFDVDRLDGEARDVTLVIGDQTAEDGSSDTRQLPGATSYKIKPVSVRPDAPDIIDAVCIGWIRNQHGAVYEKIKATELEIQLTPDIARLTCHGMDGFEYNGRDLDLAKTSSPIELPVVPIARNGVELGVELRTTLAGVVVAAVAAEAKAAGLLPGDIIRAVDNQSVAGFTQQSVYEFGFNIPPGHEVTWTIERQGATRTLHAKAPGEFKPPLYLRERPGYLEFVRKMRRSGKAGNPLDLLQ